MAGMVFGCGQYHLAVAVMVCGRYGHTPMMLLSMWCALWTVVGVCLM